MIGTKTKIISWLYGNLKVLKCFRRLPRSENQIIISRKNVKSVKHCKFYQQRSAITFNAALKILSFFHTFPLLNGEFKTKATKAVEYNASLRPLFSQTFPLLTGRKCLSFMLIYCERWNRFAFSLVELSRDSTIKDAIKDISCKTVQEVLIAFLISDRICVW